MLEGCLLLPVNLNIKLGKHVVRQCRLSPDPGPLPRGEGGAVSAILKIGSTGYAAYCQYLAENSESYRTDGKL